MVPVGLDGAEVLQVNLVGHLVVKLMVVRMAMAATNPNIMEKYHTEKYLKRHYLSSSLTMVVRVTVTVTRAKVGAFSWAARAARHTWAVVMWPAEVV